jgi:hypothetical protein
MDMPFTRANNIALAENFLLKIIENPETRQVCVARNDAPTPVASNYPSRTELNPTPQPFRNV